MLLVLDYKKCYWLNLYFFVEDDTYFNNNVEGVEIHAECLSQDFDDIAWEPIVDDSPIVDPENDVFGYYD
jgi:hypothetical protein